MAEILPFKAVRPAKAKAGLVVSRSYQDYSKAEIAAQLESNPYSFLHIINPEYDLQEKNVGGNRFKMIKERYLQYKEDGTFIKDEEPFYYVYKIETPQDSCCGIIAAASARDYENNIIKKHEDTIAHREILFKEYLQVVGFNAEPVLLTFQDNKIIERVISETLNTATENEFTTADGEKHSLWKISNPEVAESLRSEFANIGSLYIADGHHRCASSALLAKESRAKNPEHTGKEPYNYFLSYIISEKDLKIDGFSRLISDLNSHSKEEFLFLLKKNFSIKNYEEKIFVPAEKHQFSMYLDGQYYSLQLKKTGVRASDSRSQLDAVILHENILKPILGIQDLRNDKRISYFPGTDDNVEIKRQVDSGKFAVGFAMLPPGIAEIKQIAEENLTMPPKSTYIEPKLRSGLTIYEF
ncbi:DUF1015 domain-containing protein [Salegentibacter sp. F188]|uniref:DUF1015 domain-containing protein n=1 Tax=Autumnicola patrickiae TaxID=3075591 RepID=A0ABU3DX21_9FLAO|nr:DUF1015 domain-containing protein [Salegentibacter sp. F188]MDT0688267.1 DUF1015 domain-containing protein [Salegentibacter sp. F188]